MSEDANPKTFTEVQAEEQTCIQEQRKTAWPNGSEQNRYVGLAFSGGGIRSATFNLGVLQALAERKLLRAFDYFSTVSGGGYVGGWFHALLHRLGNGDVRTLEEGGEQCIAPHEGRDEHPAVQALRRYSNYLTPRYGVFSLDTLGAVGNLLRNLVLNQLILIALLAATLLLPRLLAAVSASDGARSAGWLAALLTLCGAALAGVGCAHLDFGRSDNHRLPKQMARQPHTAPWAAVLFLFAALLLALWFTAADQLQHYAWRLPASGASTVFVAWLTWETAAYWQRDRTRLNSAPNASYWMRTACALAASALAGLLLLCYGKLTEAIDAKHQVWFAIGPGAGLLVLGLCLVVTFYLGLLRRHVREELHEWLGRFAGLMAAGALPWLLLTAIAGYGPALLDYGDAWLKYGGGAAWLGSSLSGVLLGRSALTAGNGKHPKLELVTQAAPYAFIAGLLLTLSWGIQHGLEQWAGLAELNSCGGTFRLCADHALERSALITERTPWAALALCGITLAIALLLGRRVDVNLFSMHQFYRNRLARCYLGASRPDRHADDFTDFDPRDDLALGKLAQRPYPLLNATLNLTGRGRMDWQQRKAASFTFTPKYCGYQFPGGAEAPDVFRATKTSMMRDRTGDGRGVPLGTAVAAAGAAASPNMGYHSSPAVAFLLALFNVRLGRWCGNPQHPMAWRLASPTFGLWYLLKELFSSTTEQDGFINLTDGGHFENLAIYELVRRECRLIVVCDAGADKDYQFEDLGNAVRKCRVDFGAEIEIDPRMMAAPVASNRLRCVIGCIRYRSGKLGALLYIKPLLRHDEPADILHYANTHQDFPQQSTADQWFDEAQFESYRRLGLHTAREVFKGEQWTLPPSDANYGQWVDELVNKLLADQPCATPPAPETSA